MWGYWSTDGLGLFEYMLLAEQLKTEPIWVINNGVAHADSEPLPLCLLCQQRPLPRRTFSANGLPSPRSVCRIAFGLCLVEALAKPSL